MNYRTLILFFLLLASRSEAQDQFVKKTDLRPSWITYREGAYRQFDALDEVNTIYFSINPAAYRKDYLVLKNSTSFSVLINETLIIDRVYSITLSIDSIQRVYHWTNFFIAIHQDQKIDKETFITEIKAKTLTRFAKREDSFLKKNMAFRDFVVTAVLILVIFLVSLVRLNPGLSSDYFSITKVFSLRESEDDHYYYRVTSATILFYLFTSLMLAFNFLITAQFVNTEIEWLNNLSGYTYWLIMLTWLKFTLLILALMLAKSLIIYAMATLFATREAAGYHFFNFVRLILVATGLLTLILSVYFILHGQNSSFYNFFYLAGRWILAGWMILVFFKLVNRVRHTPFHLFSYICATELIPFLLIIKYYSK